MRQVCVERALPSSIEIRRFAHTNFLANELPARDLWKAKRPGGALATAVSPGRRCGSARVPQPKALSNLMGDAPPRARAWPRAREIAGSALRCASPPHCARLCRSNTNYAMRTASQDSAAESAGDQQYRFEGVHLCDPPATTNGVPRAPEGHVGATAEKPCHGSNLLRAMARHYFDAWPRFSEQSIHFELVRHTFKGALSFPPRAVIAPTAATETSTAITAYSMAVAPLSLRRNRPSRDIDAFL